MPVDASIPLSYRPARMMTPVEAAERRASLRSIGQREALQEQAFVQNQMQMQDKAETRERAQKAQALFARGLPADQMIAEAMTFDPVLANQLQKTKLEKEKAERAQQVADYELGRKIKTDFAAALVPLLDTEKDEDLPGAYQTTLARLQANEFYRKNPVGQQVLAGVPKTLEGRKALESMAQELGPEVMAVRARMKREQAQETRATTAGAQGTELHRARLPGEQAKGEQAQRTAASQLMGAAQNQDQWTAYRGTLREEMLPLVPETFSTESKKQVRELGLTPEQRQRGAGQVRLFENWDSGAVTPAMGAVDPETNLPMVVIGKPAEKVVARRPRTSTTDSQANRLAAIGEERDIAIENATREYEATREKEPGAKDTFDAAVRKAEARYRTATLRAGGKIKKQEIRPKATGGEYAVNPTTGEAVKWDGKAWVPVQ